MSRYDKIYIINRLAMPRSRAQQEIDRVTREFSQNVATQYYISNVT